MSNNAAAGDPTASPAFGAAFGAVESRVVEYGRARDARLVIYDDAWREAMTLFGMADRAFGGEVTSPAFFLVGWLCWCRYQEAAPGSDIENDALHAAVSAFARLPHALHSRIPEPLRQLVAVIWDRSKPRANMPDLGADGLLSLYQASGEKEILERAIAAARQELAADPSAVSLVHFVYALKEYYSRTGDMHSLDEAIDVGTQWRSEFRGQFFYPSVLANLGTCLRERFVATGAGNDLSEACVALGEACEAMGPNYPFRPAIISDLALALRSRACRDEDIEGFAVPLRLGREAVDLSAEPVERAKRLINLAETYRARYRVSDDRRDIDAAMEACTQALGHFPISYDGRSVAVRTTLEIQEMVAAGATHAAPDSADPLSAAAPPGSADDYDEFQLGSLRLQRLLVTGDTADLDASVELLGAAAAAVDQSSPVFSAVHNQLGVALRRKFQATGDLALLGSSVRSGRLAVAHVRPENDHGAAESNLALSLRHRYRRIGDLADLDEAVTLLSRSLDLVTAVVNGGAVKEPPATTGSELPEPGGVASVDPRELSLTLSNLGVALRLRYEALRDPADLKQAIECGRRAVQTARDDDRARGQFLNNLVRALRLAALSDGLGEAVAALRSELIETAREAVRVTPQGDPEKPMRMSTLCEVLSECADGDRALLDEAVVIGRGALARTPPDMPSMPASLAALASALKGRVEAGYADRYDLDETVAALRIGANLRTATTAERLHFMAQWAHYSRLRGRDEEAVAAYASSVELLPFVAWPSLSRGRREELLVPWRDLARDAAAHTLSTGRADFAAELLEEGRGILWTQSLNLRSDLTALTEVDPELAERLRLVRQQLVVVPGVGFRGRCA